MGVCALRRVVDVLRWFPFIFSLYIWMDIYVASCGSPAESGGPNMNLYAILSNLLHFQQLHIGGTPCWTCVNKALHLCDITSFCSVMTSLMMSSHAHAAGHMTSQYKRSCMQWEVLLLRPSRVWTVQSMHWQQCMWYVLATGAYYLQTVLSMFSYVLSTTRARYMCSSVPGKPGSAAHSSSSTTSAGLLFLSVGACVHYRRRRKQTPNVCHAHHTCMNMQIFPPVSIVTS